ncbi:MAG: hypothetical protein Q4A03_02485 [Rothia sp. (in: high G+C Gram-positive bacteria)]|nr:hypothetical protein [Rothia sp. (in: high G+C Gram-positive bacteria)]
MIPSTTETTYPTALYTLDNQPQHTPSPAEAEWARWGYDLAKKETTREAA